MISYLLSGWRVYVPDENGNPLYHGRVYFYDASTSEPSTVYADKEQVTALGTYVDVDNHGYLPPVWLAADHLYKVVVKRLIQADPETWDTLWEIDDVGNPFLTYNDASNIETVYCVNSISELRNIDPRDSESPDLIFVMGWYEPGDTGSPMLFKWTPGASGNDGHWITPSITSVGAWEQFFDGDIDPRKFGAIPDSVNSCDTALSNCMLYASEPHTYDASDTNVYKPKTVRFSRSGTYKLEAAFDFSYYTMIAQYDSAPVPVVIESGVFFNKNITLGKGFTILGNLPVSDGLLISDPQSIAKVSWFGVQAYMQNSASRVIVVDTPVTSNFIYLTGRIVINLLDSLPPLHLTDCIMVDAKNGTLFPTLIKLGGFLLSHGHNDSPSYDIFELKDTNGNDVFHVYGSVPYFDNELNLLAGFKVNANNYMEYDSGTGSWVLHADNISSNNLNGYFKGRIKPTVDIGYVEFEVATSNTTGNHYTYKNFNLEDGCIGHVVLSYESGGAYLYGVLKNTLINKQIVISIQGTHGSTVNMPIERWNILIPVMRIGTSFSLGIPRELRTKTDSNDTSQSCHISWSVSNIS